MLILDVLQNYGRKLMPTDNDVITCNDQIKGEKFIQIPLNKEQRACLLETILCSKQQPKHECLVKVIDELDRHVRAEDPERYEQIRLKFLVSMKCS